MSQSLPKSPASEHRSAGHKLSTQAPPGDAPHPNRNGMFTEARCSCVNVLVWVGDAAKKGWFTPGWGFSESWNGGISHLGWGIVWMIQDISSPLCFRDPKYNIPLYTTTKSSTYQNNSFIPDMIMTTQICTASSIYSIWPCFLLVCVKIAFRFSLDQLSRTIQEWKYHFSRSVSWNLKSQQQFFVKVDPCSRKISGTWTFASWEWKSTLKALLCVLQIFYTVTFFTFHGSAKQLGIRFEQLVSWWKEILQRQLLTPIVVSSYTKRDIKYKNREKKHKFWKR